MNDALLLILCITLVGLFFMGFDAYLIGKIWPSAGGKEEKLERAFKVEVQGSSGLLYIQDGKRMKIESETLIGSAYDMIVYTGSIKSWEPPFEQEHLSEDLLGEISANIKAGLEANKLKVEMKLTRQP